MRAFLCLELGEKARDEVNRVIEMLKGSGLIRANFVAKQNLHLTLKFFKEISNIKIDEIREKLEQIKFKKFRASLGKLGFFPSESFIRIVWVSLESEDKQVFSLYEKIKNVLSETGIERDWREFQSHITIARIKSLKDRKMFIDVINEMELERIEFLVDKIKLKKSTLTDAGPIYEDVFKIELG